MIAFLAEETIKVPFWNDGADPNATDLPTFPEWDMDDIRATHGPDGKPIPLRPMEACIYAVLPVLDSDHPAKLEMARGIMEKALQEFEIRHVPMKLAMVDYEALLYADRPAWVLTTQRALQLRDALEKAEAKTEEDYLAVLAKLWPDLSLETIMTGIRWAVDSDPVGVDPECDGLCVMGYDIMGPEDGVPWSVLNDVAYPNPGCPLHAPGQACGCTNPNCISPTHERTTDG